MDWGTEVHHILASALSRLEQVSCLTNGPDMSTSCDFFEEDMGRLPSGPHEDNRTRGHRAANTIRELMPVPVLCCWTEKELYHRETNMTLQLNRRLMEKWMEARTDYPGLRWPGSVRGTSD